MSKPFLLFKGPVATRSGYGDHARDLLESLFELDKYEIKIVPTRWGNTPQNQLNPTTDIGKKIIENCVTQIEKQPDIFVQLTVANEFEPIGKYNIGITAGVETTIAPKEFIDGCNRMNLVIVPTKFTKQTLLDTVYDERDNRTQQLVRQIKITTPIEVLHEGVDLETWQAPKKIDNFLEGIETDFNFLVCGHWLQGDLGQDRKDTGMLLKTFLETFKNKPNPPALLMKTSGATFSIMDRNEIKQKIDDIKSTVKGKLPPVYFLHGNLTDEEMNQMYNHNKVKAHITFTHGEGFGRPLLEASLSEKIVIAPSWSGHIDFLNKNNSVLLPGTMTPVHKSALPKEMLVDGAQWFTVNYQYASKVMMDVFKKNRKYTLMAKRQSMYNRVNFSMTKMTKEFHKILNKYLPKFEEQPQQVDLKLPKLKKVDSQKPEKMKLPKLKKV